MNQSRSQNRSRQSVPLLPRRFKIILLTAAIVVGALSAYLFWINLE